MSSLSLKQIFFTFFIVLISFFALSLLFAPKVYAAKIGQNGDNVPPHWDVKGTDIKMDCAWQNASFINCHTSRLGTSRSDGIRYFYDIQASMKAGHDVFRAQNPDDNAGYLHMLAGNYKADGVDKAFITNSPTDPSNGWYKDKGAEVTNGAKRDVQIAGSGEPYLKEDTCSIIYTEPGCKNGWDGQPNDNVPDDFASSYGTQLDRLNSERDCGDDSSLNFITCPLFKMVNNSIAKLVGSDGSGRGLLIDLFYLTPLNTAPAGSQDNPLQAAWESIKNITLSIYVLIFMVVIFANSFSIGVDAYTIKKTLPRIMMAALFTQFSFVLLAVAIDISNIIGIAVPSFILSTGPQTYQLQLSGWASMAILSGPGFLLILILAIMALFGLFCAVITMVARQLIVFALVLTAPIAIACWVLPNTEKLFKKWSFNLFRVLAMFPMVTGLIATAILFSRVASAARGINDMAEIAAALAPMIALAILPKTFKWGGDFVSAATGAAAGWIARGQSATFKKGRGMTKDSAKSGNIARLRNFAAIKRDKDGNIIGTRKAIGRVPGLGGIRRKTALTKTAKRDVAISAKAKEGMSDMSPAALKLLAYKYASRPGSPSYKAVQATMSQKYSSAMSDYYSALSRDDSSAATFQLSQAEILSSHAKGAKGGPDAALVYPTADSKEAGTSTFGGATDYADGKGGAGVTQAHLDNVGRIQERVSHKILSEETIISGGGGGGTPSVTVNPNINISSPAAPPPPNPGGTTPPIGIGGSASTPNPGAVDLSGLEPLIKSQNALLEDIKGNTSGGSPAAPPPEPDHDHRDNHDGGYL